MSDATFGKVFAGTLAGLVAVTVFLIILANAVGGDVGRKNSDVMIKAQDAVILERTTPVGSVAVGEVADQAAADATPAAVVSGEQVYQSACVACHGAGVAGAPKLGDAAAWEPRMAQGKEVLYEHALNGFNTMPAKGGNASLGDDVVKSAVDYMIGGGAGGQQSDSTAQTQLQNAATTQTGGGKNAEPPAATDHSAGEAVYNTSCSVCHTAGIAGAPKQGDPAAWEPRIAQGVEVLYEHALNGFNTMPPKGGNVSLKDDDVKGAVNFMLSTVQ